MRSACTGQTAWTTLLVLLVGWGLALVATGFLLSAVLNRSVGRTRTHPPAMRCADTVVTHCYAEPRRRAAAAVCRRNVRQTARFGCSARAATVLGYVVVLFGNGVGLLLADGIFGDLPGLSLGGRASACPVSVCHCCARPERRAAEPLRRRNRACVREMRRVRAHARTHGRWRDRCFDTWPRSERMPLWLLLNPQFAMVRRSAAPAVPYGAATEANAGLAPQVRAVYKLNFACAALLDCYGPISSLAVDDEVVVCLLMLFVDAVTKPCFLLPAQLPPPAERVRAFVWLRAARLCGCASVLLGGCGVLSCGSSAWRC